MEGNTFMGFTLNFSNCGTVLNHMVLCVVFKEGRIMARSLFEVSLLLQFLMDTLRCEEYRIIC